MTRMTSQSEMNRRQLLDADWARLRSIMGLPATARPWRASLSPRFAAVALLRTAQRLHARGWRRVAKIPSLVNFLVFGIEVPPSLQIGPGLILPHPQGVILGAAIMGANVTVYQQVTFGAKIADWSYDRSTRPIVEDDVVVTAGARVLGPIRLGRGCVVGANAVVIDDVPPGAIVGGVPARVLTGSNV